jgi:hypothetical protein
MNRMDFCPASLTAGKKARGVSVACGAGWVGVTGVGGGAAAVHAVKARHTRLARKNLINTARL